MRVDTANQTANPCAYGYAAGYVSLQTFSYHCGTINAESQMEYELLKCSRPRRHVHI